ncbi:hypothetical protein EDC01DRAFT_668058 [Geopyxis carbonaria]|nr:hypothetical protein EDC01DRAFT_668058 [Geopyxis carbonaria]
MPPRLTLFHGRTPSAVLRTASICTPRFYASAIFTPTVANPIRADPPISLYPPTQPPSHRAADARKTQLHRSYLSLLRSTPLMLVFQHNNLRAVEWSAIRREIATALAKLTPADQHDEVAEHIKITMLRTQVFSSAVRVAEFYDTVEDSQHGTSRDAYEKTKKQKKHALAPLLTGPVGVVSFPAVSPAHLKTVMDIMFPAGKPIRGMAPLATSGLQKLILLAARVDGHVAAAQIGQAQVLDSEKVRWVSALPGFEGLRGQLVAILQSVGGGELVRSLESIPTSIVRTLDGHRKVLSGELDGEKKE